MVGRFAIGLRLVTLATGMVVAVAPARAEVAVEAGVPFTGPQLSAALALRHTRVVDVVVRAVSATEVELSTPIGRQRVDLGAASGLAAARLVALQLAPLSIDLRLPGPPPLSPIPPPRDARVAFTAGGGRGLEAVDFGATVLRAAATWSCGRLRCGGEVAWLHELQGPQAITGELTADFVVVRAVAGVAIGSIAVVGGPEVAPYRIGNAASGTTVGAGGSLRMQMYAGAHWQALATFDVDVFNHRVVLEHNGAEVASTPRVLVSTTLGVAWGGP